MYNILHIRCREWRIRNRYTMQAVADAGNVSRQAVYKFERGLMPSTKIARSYAALGMDLTDAVMEETGRSSTDLLLSAMKDGDPA